MDYPLLIPVNVVGGWNTLASEVLRVPAMLSMLFLLGMAGTLYSTLACLRSASQAAIATIVLLATPGLLLFSTFQTSDIPLTYFFLASLSLLVLAAKETNVSLFFLSGMMAGLSAWTKNEGIPFVLLLLVFTRLIVGLRRARVVFPAVLAGCALPLLTIFLFKMLISVNNDLFTNNGLPEILGKLLDPARYVQIFTHLAGELIRLGNWPLSILVLLIIYGWIVGFRAPANFVEKAVWMLPVVQLLLYLLVYVVTPHELQWHMNYSMSRLLIHLFPTGLFAYFLFVDTPEAVLSK
jgi:4-amino-4-deoxy-L-arabinose transferase-like glycosyltransferase